ncbi:hypothetical protein ACFQVA_07310 [Actinomadura keratinilytica]
MQESINRGSRERKTDQAWTAPERLWPRPAAPPGPGDAPLPALTELDLAVVNALQIQPRAPGPWSARCWASTPPRWPAAGSGSATPAPPGSTVTGRPPTTGRSAPRSRSSPRPTVPGRSAGSSPTTRRR